jgi:hypothetical protein
VTTTPAGRISRDDIEAKLQEIRGVVDNQTREVMDKAKIGAVVAGVALAVLLYFLGLRSGKKQRTIVEIRRV